jgi:Condensation domain
MRPIAKGHEILPSTNDFVRYLGAFEHLHWLFSQSGPRAFAHAIEVLGTTTVEQWRTALDALQRSQPFFSVRIDVDDQKRPYFRQVDDSPIPMRVLDGRLSASWEAEMGKEVSTMVSADHAPLLRAVLIHEAERSIFIITAHHSISDGVSMTAALCELVRALSGEELERRPMLPSPEDLLGVVSTISTVRDQTHHAVVKGNDLTSFGQSYVEPFTVQSLRLDAALTSRIRKRARTEESTLHGALCSAVIHAARMTSPAWKQATMRLLSPINARHQCGIGNTSSMCIGAAIIPIAPGQEFDLWRLARRVNSEHAGPVSRAGLTLALQMISDAVANISNVRSALDFIEPVFAYQVAVSNVGELLSASKESAIRIAGMWGPSNLLGFEREQLVGAVTVNECLHLLYTAYSPIPHFMECVRDALIAMCEEQPRSNPPETRLRHSKAATST